MRICMLRNAKGSPDGINQYHYEAGAVYTASADLSDVQPLPISHGLAALFVAEGWAEDADAVSGAALASSSVAASPVEPPQAFSEQPAQE